MAVTGWRRSLLLAWPYILAVMIIYFTFLIYLGFGRTYRAGILTNDLINDFQKNHIEQGCSLPTLLSYLEKRHGDPYVVDYTKDYLQSKPVRCTLPTTMNHLEKRRADPAKYAGARPYIIAFMGFKDWRLFSDKADIRFRISDHGTLEDYSISPTATPDTWTDYRPGR